MSVSGCRKAQGEAASTKLNTRTHPYYDGILTAYTPAIDHGQDSDRGGRCGLGLKARVRKVKNLTTHVEMAPPCCGEIVRVRDTPETGEWRQDCESENHR